ncbi:Cell division protein FtsA [subsurface metagenome]
MAKTKQVVGIDIGADAVKIVKLSRKGNRLTLEHLDHIPIQRDQAESPDQERIIEALRQIDSRLVSSADRVASALSIQASAVRTLSIPRAHISDLERTLKAEIEPHIPFPIEEIVVDFYTTSRADDENAEIVITAAPKENLRKHLDLLNKVGIDPEIVDIDYMAAFAAAKATCAAVNTGPAGIIIEMGATKTIALAVANGVPLIARAIPVGGDDFTHAIAAELGTNFKEAETIKKERADCEIAEQDATEDQERKIARAVGLSLAKLERELSHTVHYFSTRIKDNSLEYVVLLGGGANLKNIDKFVGRVLSAEVIKPNVSTFGADQDKAPDITACSTAYGLALRATGAGSYALDLRREEFTFTGKAAHLKKSLYLTAGLVVTTILIWIVYLLAELSRLDSQHRELQSHTRVTLIGLSGEYAEINSITELEAQLRRIRKELSELRGVNPTSALEILRHLSQEISPDMKIQVNKWELTNRSRGGKIENRLEMKGTVAQQEDVYELKDIIERLSFVEPPIKVGRIKLEGNRHTFVFTVTLREKR